MTAALEAMKSVHSSMVFSRDSFIRFRISYIFMVILKKTVRTANHIAGFLARIYFRIQIYIYIYIYIVLLNSQKQIPKESSYVQPPPQKSLTLDSGRERSLDQRVVVRRLELNRKRG